MADQQRVRAFRERVSSGKVTLGMTCSTMSPVTAEILGRAGFDFIILDFEQWKSEETHNA